MPVFFPSHPTGSVWHKSLTGFVRVAVGLYVDLAMKTIPDSQPSKSLIKVRRLRACTKGVCVGIR